MTDFPEELRHYCRNPRCRCKLSEPVTNLREAFCSRGCYEGFWALAVNRARFVGPRWLIERLLREVPVVEPAERQVP